jgi:hypothetical protein
MGKNVLHSNFYAINMDDVDIILGYPWMDSIVKVNINVQKKFLKLWYCCRLIHTWETWKKSSIHSVCPWGQVRVKVLSPNPQLLRLGQLLAKPRGVVPNKYTKALKLSTRN